MLLSVKNISFSPVSSWVLILAIVLILIVFVARFYAPKDPRISAKRKRLLIILRVAAFVCVIWALLQPVVNLESKESRRPQVFVLIDGSASMKLPFDVATPSDSSHSREDTAVGFARRLLGKLPRRFESSVFVFSDSLRKLDSRPGVPIIARLPVSGLFSTSADSAILSASGSRSSLGQALEDISSKAGRAPAAVVVISDGANTFGPDPTRVAKTVSLPVYTVLSAKEGPLRDIEITEILHPTSGYANTEMPLLIRVRGYGLENLTVPLSISEGETIVARGVLKLAGAAETEIALSIRPNSAGLHFYRASIPVIRGEVSTVNNEASFALKVLSEKLNVLFIEGEISWDFEFLKRQLDSDPRLSPTYVLVSSRRAQPPSFAGLVTSMPGGFGRNSVVFICDGAARYLRPDTWRSLDNFVSSGGGLFIVGAEGLSGIPAFAQKLLPAQLAKPDLWEPPEFINCRLTFAGLNHPIFEVEKEAAENASSWREISPLLGSHVIGAVKPGASVLVEGITDNRSFPVIVAGPCARGKVLFIAASGVWRWGFSVPGVGGSDRLFSGFVSNAIWWLSETEKDTTLDVTPRSWVFENGEEVIFSGRGVPQVIDKNGKILRPILTRRVGEDSLLTDYGILKPGNFSYEASPQGEAKQGAASVSGRFIVDSNGPEFRNLIPDARLLDYVSEASGGKSFRIDQADALAHDIQTFEEKATVERQVKLWNNPLLFLAFTLLIATEWWLRRRSGLP